MRTAHTNVHTPELPTPYYAVPPAHVKTISEIMRANGYYCTNNAKTDYQFQPPLTAWDENGKEAHFRKREDGQPFFAVFNYDATHESGMWPAEFMRQFMPNYEERPLITNPDQVELPPYLPNTPKSRAALARHYDNLANADEYVGRILQQLEEDGLSDNTIVMLWSDHGEGLPRAKRWTYDAGIRVPLIVKWPEKVEKGQISEQLVSMIDLGPTVLALAGIPVPQHIQGQSFMGEHVEKRDYVFATRDRYDEAYDKVRAVRDTQFKYIRNDYPDQPYLQWIPFSHFHPICQELWRLQLAGELEGDKQVLMQNKRPPEELYDCLNDPHELNNLADDPSYRTVRTRLRKELDDWCGKYDVWGDIPETQMVAAMWPSGIQPQTAKPLFIPINSQLPGKDAMDEGTFKEATALMLYSATQGASIAYTTDGDLNPRWQLYTGPIILTAGHAHIRAIAVRIGYKDSEVAEASFVVE
ncbi:sulfatase [Paenibacillus ferrarius]|uniref:Sulfatase n=2 Tax=Paenibacillus ferrarius TaxID=1469647 RepID=A0A1V4HM19_9BACL|nr:sulfatase [Paenibacillus ferrarius]